MSKKYIFVSLVIVLIAVGAVGYKLFYKGSGSEDQNLPSYLSEPTALKEKVEADVTYEDAAGFSFAHPTDITVKDITPEDDETYYSSLTLARSGGEMNIFMRDTKYDDIEEFIDKDSVIPQGAGQVGATKLSNIEAYQYTASGRLYTVAMDRGVLFFFESQEDGGFWEDVHNLAVSTFIFAGQQKSSAGSGTNVIYEAEEVIQ